MTDGHINLESLNHKLLQPILQQVIGAKDTHENLDLSRPFFHEANEEIIAK
jgi:hypothetical protein